MVSLVPAIIPYYGAKAQELRTLTGETLVIAIGSLNPRASRLVLPIIFEGMESEDWRVKQGSVQLVGVLSKHSASQLNICMPLLVPRVTMCLRDTKKEVSKAAKAALNVRSSCGWPRVVCLHVHVLW